MAKKEKEEYQENIPACIIKIVAITYLTLGLLSCFFGGKEVFSNENMVSIGIVLGGSALTYGFAELIQLTHDIRRKLYAHDNKKD